jgi:hypothetical protein
LRPAADRASRLTLLVERAGDALSTFVCTRADFLSGDPARAFDLACAQAIFVDRILLANVVESAITARGEELVPHVALPPIRRADTLIAMYALLSLTLLCAVAYPMLPRATKHAMGTLKRSLHSCYFCFERGAAALPAEVAFFQARLGGERTLDELCALRDAYRPSFGFVVRAAATIARLHLHTALHADLSRPGRATSA